MPAPTYESTFVHLSAQSYNGGIEPYYDFLRLLVAMLCNEGGIPGKARLAELAYHLNDEQRRGIQRLAAAAGRLDDAAIVAELSVEQFQAQWSRRFGASNPEQMDMPFWVFMVQRGWNAYTARKQFNVAYRQYMDAFSELRRREEAGEVVPDGPELPFPPPLRGADLVLRTLRHGAHPAARWPRPLHRWRARGFL